MPYTYDHPRPAVTADVAAFTRREGALCLLLVQRGGEPFAGQWALPGGFPDPDEDLEACARRELKEEAGVEAAALTVFGQFSAPDRDPRGRTISVAFLTVLEPVAADPKGADDAAQARWWPVDSLPKLAFDHAEIVAEALAFLRRRDDLEKLAE
ncbi:MAG TPA: NUDIX hydrolase [Caulobacteraceae bacterium]|jgi:8-oxo-dGTP diphosphatase